MCFIVGCMHSLNDSLEVLQNYFYKLGNYMIQITHNNIVFMFLIFCLQIIIAENCIFYIVNFPN